MLAQQFDAGRLFDANDVEPDLPYCSLILYDAFQSLRASRNLFLIEPSFYVMPIYFLYDHFHYHTLATYIPGPPRYLGSEAWQQFSGSRAGRVCRQRSRRERNHGFVRSHKAVFS
jgi:hypothetical protein